MEFRAVLLFTGVYVLQGYYTNGPQTYRFVGLAGPLNVVASQGQILADLSGGAHTYNASNHDPF